METMQRNEGPGPFLTTTEAGNFLKLKPNTLEKMRVYGGGPIYRKHGRHVRYHIEDLTDWSNLRKMDSTSDVRTSDAR